MKSIEIREKKIGDGEPCFVIAEAGVNHNGSLETAKGLVDAALEAGADAVKFQTFKAEKIIAPTAPKAEYQKETTGTGESQLEMVCRLEMPEAMTRAVATYAGERGIMFLSTGFDEDSVDLLDDVGVPAFKVGSGDVTNLPLLEFIGRKRKPVILSTGMSSLEEVESAVNVLIEAGSPALALLQCVSSYPADDPKAANLRVIQTLKDRFGVPVGFSDHFLNNDIAVAAVAVGANIVEKHLTLDTNFPGPDHRVSLAPDRFKALVSSIRVVESAMGDGVKRPTACEENVRDVARRSIVAGRSIPTGATITRDMLAFKRPGIGISPAHWQELIGKRALREIAKDALITMKDLG